MSTDEPAIIEDDSNVLLPDEVDEQPDQVTDDEEDDQEVDNQDDLNVDDTKGDGAPDGEQPDSGTKPTDAEGDDTDLKPESKHYYERQLGKKDRTIENLTKALEEQYIAKAGDNETERRLRSVEARDMVRDIEAARNTITSDYRRAQTDFDIFNPNSKTFDKTVHDRVMARFARDNLIEQDIKGPDGKPSKEIVGYRVPLYDYLAEMNDLLSAAKSAGAKGQRNAAATMDANADVPANAATPTKPETNEDDDPFLKGFNSVK